MKQSISVIMLTSEDIEKVKNLLESEIRTINEWAWSEAARLEGIARIKELAKKFKIYNLGV